MKRKLCMLLVAVCCMAVATPVRAQFFKWGVKGGLNLSKVDVSGSLPGKGNTTAFFIGPMAEVTIPIVGIGVDGALMYSQRGESDYKQQGIEIPINLKYTFGLGSMLGVYVAAGPDFYFNFKDVKVNDWDVNTEKKQVGLNLGVGLKLIQHLQVGVNYQVPLGNSFTLESVTHAATGGAKGKTKTWQVSLAYLF